MWKLYDALIEKIPSDLTVLDAMCVDGMAYVRSEYGTGLGSTRNITTRQPVFAGNMIGSKLKDVAECIKSWNLSEAGLGQAAINAYYNAPEIARANGVDFSDAKMVNDRLNNPFITSQNEMKGRTVSVVGHFPYIDRLLEPICQLNTIELDPEEGSFPFSAAEYLIPESEFVFITCASFSEKTLPRLIECAKNAKKITIVGPSTTLSPVLFDFGVSNLSSFIVKDDDLLKGVIAGTRYERMYKAGQKVNYSNIK